MSLLNNIWNTVIFYCTYVYYFLLHCYHPPVDMWRVFAYNFEWEPTLHTLYVDAINHGNFNPEEDFATVVGCSTGVGFEVAAGLASVGLTVFAGIRGDSDRVEQVVEELKKRSKLIHLKHFFNKKNNTGKFVSSFEPRIIGMQVDVSEMKSCIRFAENVAEKLDKKSSQTEASSSSPRRSRSSSTSRKSTKNTTASTTSSSSKKQLRIALMNAAVLMSDYQQTSEGFEAQAATNALGHFVIAEHLIDSGCFTSSTASAKRDSRLIFVSSSGARFGEPLRGTLSNINNQQNNEHHQLLHPSKHCQFKMYGDSKALVASYAKLLQKKVLDLQSSSKNASSRNVQNLSIRALHPGCIASCIVRDSGMPGGKVLAKLQATVGLWIGAMITEERASVYPLRLCLGVAGKLKEGDIKREDYEFFSYIFTFEPYMMARYLKDEKLMEMVRVATTKALAPFLPNRKSILNF